MKPQEAFDRLAPLGKRYRNTTVRREGDDVVVTLHNTDIVRVETDRGQARLQAGGWRTVTTKKRINEALQALGSTLSVWQDDHAWYVAPPGVQRSAAPRFFDGTLATIGG